MENKEEILLNGEKITLPSVATDEEMNDFLINDEEPTRDLSEVLESTKEIDWSNNE